MKKIFTYYLFPLLVVLAIIFMHHDCLAETYYVRTDGNNSQSGLENSSGSAWQTVDYAADHVSAGDVVRVQAGTYTEWVTPAVSGTSSENTVTYVADGEAILCGFYISNKNYLRVIGFTVDTDTEGCTMQNGGVIISGINSYLEFWNNTMRDACYNGIRIGSGQTADRINNSLIIGNHFSYFGTNTSPCLDNPGSGTAVSIRGEHNLVGYNEIEHVDPDAFAVPGNYNRFVNNYMHDAHENGDGHPDFFQAGSSVIGWAYNLFEANFEEGVSSLANEHAGQFSNGQAASYCPEGCGAMNENVFRRNIWHNISSGTIGINQTFDGQISYTRYYHNTTAGASRAYPDNYTELAWYHAGSVNSYLLNNISYNGWGDNRTTNIIVYEIANTPRTLDYNLAYDSDGPVSFASIWTSQAHPQSNINPWFVDFGNDNFSLGENSGAIDNGGPLTITSSSGSGTVFQVAENNGGFFRGDDSAISQYAGQLVAGDVITVGTDVVEVASVSGDTITTKTAFSWEDGDPVSFGSDDTPDIGALPYRSSYALTGAWNISNGTVRVTPNDPSLVRFVVVYEDGLPVGADSSEPYYVPGIGSGVVTAKIYSLFASESAPVEASFDNQAPLPDTTGPAVPIGLSVN